MLSSLDLARAGESTSSSRLVDVLVMRELAAVKGLEDQTSSACHRIVPLASDRSMFAYLIGPRTLRWHIMVTTQYL